jgi:hypothetical protein
VRNNNNNKSGFSKRISNEMVIPTYTKNIGPKNEYEIPKNRSSIL